MQPFLYTLLVVVLLPASALLPSLQANTTLTTQPASDIIGITSDVGQTFVVPTNGDNILSDFSFILAGAGLSTPSYEVYLYGFDPTSGVVTTAPLYDSLQRVAQPAEFVSNTFTPLTALTLVPGNTYMAVVRIEGLTGNTPGQTQLDLRYNGSMERKGDPSFIRSNDSNTGPNYTNSVWGGDPVDPNSPGQLGLTVDFVPEPSAVTLLWASACFLMAVAFCRRLQVGK